MFRAHIQMPYFEGGTLLDWLKEHSPPVWAVESVLRSLLQTLAALHDRGIVHRDIKPQNVLIGAGGQPFLTDFELSRPALDSVHTDPLLMASTSLGGGGAAGTRGYQAPELLRGGSHSAATDMYAFGALFYAALFNQLPPPRRMGLIPLPPGRRVTARVHEALDRLLSAQPSARPSAGELLRMPAFSGSVMEDLAEERAVLTREGKLAVAKLVLGELRRHARGMWGGQSLHLRVHREPQLLVQDVTDALMGATTGQVRTSRLHVAYVGEPGIDEGGLRRELYTSYALALCAVGGPLEGGLPPSSPADKEGACRACEAAGQMIGKALLDGEVWPAGTLTQALLRLLLGQRLSLADVEEADASPAEAQRFLLAHAPTDAPEGGPGPWGDWGLEFDDGTAVTDENKARYVDERVHDRLVKGREAGLEALRKGLAAFELDKVLGLLAAGELQLLLHGTDKLTPELVWAEVRHSDSEWGASRTVQYLRECVFELSKEDLGRFLRLCTSSVGLPVGGLAPKITINRAAGSGMIFAHTCSHDLDMPDLDDCDAVRRLLRLALDHVDSDGFGGL